jgi:hypothetical protein
LTRPRVGPSSWLGSSVQVRELARKSPAEAGPGSLMALTRSAYPAARSRRARRRIGKRRGFHRHAGRLTVDRTDVSYLVLTTHAAAAAHASDRTFARSSDRVSRHIEVSPPIGLVRMRRACHTGKRTSEALWPRRSHCSLDRT